MRHGQVGAGWLLRRAMRNAARQTDEELMAKAKEIADQHKNVSNPNAITPEQLAASGTEHGHQAALFCWANINLFTYPQLKYLFAVPNGFFSSPGQKAKMKAEGLKDGVPDVWLPVVKWWPSTAYYSGLIIELKVPEYKKDNDPTAGATDSQIEWLNFLTEEGHKCHICYGWEEARDRIIEYLK